MVARLSRFDAVIIGSGMGGAMAARPLIDSGLRVLMLERGSTVARTPDCWAPDSVLERSPHYSVESAFRVHGDDPGTSGSYHCVGGPAVFYGAVSMRMREVDFSAPLDVRGDAPGRWPFTYADIEPYYLWAERILGVAGRESGDPTAPWRSGPYPQRAPDLLGPARLVWDSSERLGLTPFHLPLAIDFTGKGARAACVRCGTCDGHACALGSKSDPGTSVLPDLVARGLTLVSDTVAVRLLYRNHRVTGVECVDRGSGFRWIARGHHYILSAGALASPQLILASGLAQANPAGDSVGRTLMRHSNALVFGLFPGVLEGSRSFHKQVGIHDLYGGEHDRPKLGCIQSIHPPPVGMVQDRVPSWAAGLGDVIADHSTGLLVIAEDEPCRDNRVTLSRKHSDRFGVPQGVVHHSYTQRDMDARRSLARVAGRILRGAGAVFTTCYRIKTFSHAVGTVRMGEDARTSPLDGFGRFRGIDNLRVVDGSFMPRAGAVNPSLTIAANALRCASHLAGRASLTGPRDARQDMWTELRIPMHVHGENGREVSR
ncbi:MAG: GMC family oxidoreductase [Gemmatimonadota bacterium]|nr:GMC family oxidoreductase [Gemmatimonadota bacterium]MDH5759618.1 GMC family oxidoreductase [Gemmatimonadota bacterium]